MPPRHFVVATSDSEEGRAAVQAATSLGQRFQARVTVLAVASEPLKEHGLADLTRSLRDIVTRQLETVQRPHPAVHLAIKFGLPGVEIGRFADSSDADLVIMERRSRGSLESGKEDTVDAVTRRSRVPCLVVRPGPQRFDHLVVALDGTERGMAVLDGAVEFAQGARAKLRAVMVEPDGLDGERPWSSRSERLFAAVEELRRNGVLGPEQWESDPPHGSQPVLIRQGPIVEELLREAEMESTDVLVFGCHRGGPPAAAELTNIPRRLMQHSAAAVLTIPL